MNTPHLTSDDPIELLERLVETPSVSGGEAALVGFVEGQLAAWGLEPIVSGRNVWCKVQGDGGDGPTLLLNSHIDTVPPSKQWTADPWRTERFDGKVRGLGANDVKGGGAAMLCAMRDLSRAPDFRGAVVYAATCDEETGGEGLETLRAELPEFSAAVIAEPTELKVACAQRGLMRVVVECTGRSAHASRPWQGENAIELALADVRAVNGIEAPDRNRILGRATLAVTLIDGGVKPNMIPPTCRFTLDVRPTPEYPNDWWAEQIAARVTGRIVVMKKRMTPVFTDPGSRIVRAAMTATDTTEPVALGGVSDLWHVRDVPGIVLGPGRPDQSHQPDEWIEEAQVHRAVRVYTRLVKEFLA